MIVESVERMICFVDGMAVCWSLQDWRAGSVCMKKRMNKVESLFRSKEEAIRTSVEGGQESGEDLSGTVLCSDSEESG